MHDFDFGRVIFTYHSPMRITFNGKTALAITRILRTRQTAPSMWGRRVDVIPPDPTPARRFTRKLFDLQHLGLNPFSEEEFSVDVVVAKKDARLRMKGARNTIYSSERSLPAGSFIEVDDGIAISCPELLFLEMANNLPLAHLIMLGHELCGTFSRDAHDPINGEATLWCPPATSCARIGSFIQETKWNANAEKALEALSLVSDNAWSPTESVVATVASLPYEEFGYGMGRCILNLKIDTSVDLNRAVGKSSRRPDMLFEGTHVGLNYDGTIHLNLDSIVKAAMELERNPEVTATQQALDSVVREVRAKAVDDIRRNRELASAGFIVFPVTKEDLYEDGGLDTVMFQAMNTIENLTGEDWSERKRLLKVRFCREKRQELIWSLLPGKHAGRGTGSGDAEVPRSSELMIGF